MDDKYVRFFAQMERVKGEIRVLEMLAINLERVDFGDRYKWIKDNGEKFIDDMENNIG